MRRAPLVSRLATFKPSIGRRARACRALTCAYVAELDDHRPGVLLKVARGDTTREAIRRPILRPPVLGAESKKALPCYSAEARRQ